MCFLQPATSTKDLAIKVSGCSFYYRAENGDYTSLRGLAIQLCSIDKDSTHERRVSSVSVPELSHESGGADGLAS